PDRIEVVDNGHGMNFAEFKNFWMRVGSPHKESQRYSRGLHRPLTGSKGVGRLAAQFLARELELTTTSDSDTATEIVASVNWSNAIRARELTRATAEYTKRKRRGLFAGENKN